MTDDRNAHTTRGEEPPMHERSPDDLTWIGEVGVCFEDAWEEGQKPRIEDYLIGASGARRVRLLEHLLRIELELRRRQAESPDAAEYAPRFPDDADLIRRIFAQGPHDDDTETFA